MALSKLTLAWNIENVQSLTWLYCRYQGSWQREAGVRRSDRGSAVFMPLGALSHRFSKQRPDIFERRSAMHSECVELNLDERTKLIKGQITFVQREKKCLQ